MRTSGRPFEAAARSSILKGLGVFVNDPAQRPYGRISCAKATIHPTPFESATPVINITDKPGLMRQYSFVNAAWEAQDVSPFVGRHEVEVVGEAASTSLEAGRPVAVHYRPPSTATGTRFALIQRNPTEMSSP
jgi:hypothetical protein